MGLVKLPRSVDISIFLIKAELKTRKFFKSMEQIGFDTTLYLTDFSSLILNLVGFESRSDDVYDWYNKLLEDYIQRFELKDEAELLDKLALEFFVDLESYRKVNYSK